MSVLTTNTENLKPFYADEIGVSVYKVDVVIGFIN